MNDDPAATDTLSVAAQRERERRWGCWGFVAAMVVLPLFLLFGYWLHLRGVEGDYLVNFDDDHEGNRIVIFRVAARPIPRVTMLGGWPSASLGSFLYVRWGDTLALYNWSGFCGGATGTWRWPYFPDARVTLDPDTFPPLVAWSVKAHLGSSVLVEPFPLGAFDRVLASPDDAELQRAVGELSRRYPSHLAPKRWVIAALCDDGHATEARAQLEAWRPALAAGGDAARALLKELEGYVTAAEAARR